MMDIVRIIEIASELDTMCPSHADIYALKVVEPLRRAIAKKKLNFVQYLLSCSPEDRSHISSAYRWVINTLGILDSNGVIKDGYEEAYLVYKMMEQEAEDQWNLWLSKLPGRLPDKWV